MKTHHLRQVSLVALLLGAALVPVQAALPVSEKITLQSDVAELKRALANAANPAATPVQLAALPAAPKPTSPDAIKAALADKVARVAQDDNDLTVLHKFGLATNLGYGYFDDLKTYAPDVEIRYNFIKTAQLQAAISEKVALAKDPLTVPESVIFGGKITSLCGWVGYSLEKLPNRARTVAGAPVAAGKEMEAPLIAGVGIGFGGNEEFGSAITLNVGVALCKNDAFRHSQLYLGVSMDAALFQKALKALSNAAPGGGS